MITRPVENSPQQQRVRRPLNRPALPSKLSNVNFHQPHQDDAVAIDFDDLSATNSTAYSANGLAQYGQSVGTPDTDEPKQHIPPRLLSQKTSSLPLPRRPQSLNDPPRPCQPQSHASATPLRDASTTANGLRPPAVATALPRQKPADFFPWTGIAGMHAEDVLTEQVVKSGYSDKPSGATQTESNIARPHLWPSLKNRNGLHILSALFVQVLDKRAQMGRCTAPSTFKPPPRVTLTDTKREAWLKDLANPNVPLRRLSRTIPHGIRGKVLLDHCITKDIPLARAVWLSKCVGANEIRAFKRKGVSGSAALAGELKWIREWTVFVEQFVESVISSCGQSQWSLKMNYALRLATHFYSLRLLDEEHYMDWLLTSLHNSSLEKLPIWILLAQIYWRHLISQRKRGRRLAEALLTHCAALSENPYALASAQLDARLRQLIIVLAVTHRACLVLPNSWNQYKHTFASVKPMGRVNNEADSLTNVSARNERLLGASPSATSRTPKLRLLDVLDSVGIDVQIDKIAAQCESLALDTPSMLTTVLEWSSSKHRSGISRVYLAAQLIRYWSFAGMNADEAVLTMLDKARHDPDFEPHLVYKLVSALARSGHFSVGKYLQWLISTGVLSGSHASANDAQLLIELPVAYLSSHIINLRRTLLIRIGYNADAELREIENYKAALSQHLGGMSLPSPGLPSHKPVISSNPVGAVKMAVAHWLCEKVISPSIESVDDTAFNGNLASFCLVRHTLEQFEDFPSLAKVITAASTSQNPQILAAAVDTVNLRIQAFATMGFLPSLISQFYQQQRRLRSRQPLDRNFLVALSSLIRRVPSDVLFLKTIDGDLSMCDMQSSTTACSPASDSMVVSASENFDSDDDIDRILASGNTMDEQLMARMFTTVADRAVKLGPEGLSRASAWLAQIRLFDQTTFDQLVHRLMLRLVETSAHFETVEAVIVALVGSNCMKLTTFFQIWEKKLCTVKSTDPAAAGRLATTCLGVLIPSASVMQTQAPEAYRFKIAQDLFCEDHMRDMVRLIGNVLSMSAPSIRSTVSTSYVQRSLEQDILSLLRRYVVKNHDIVAEEFVAKQNHLVADAHVRLMLEALLNSNNPSQHASLELICKVDNIVTSATELSLPFCQLALQQYSSSLYEGNNVSDSDKGSLIQTIQKAIERTSSVWPQLLGALDKNLIHHIHAWAGECVLGKLSSSISATGSIEDRAAVQRYLRAVEVSAFAVQSQTAPSYAFAMLTEQLKRMGQLAEGINPLDASQFEKKERMSFGISVLLQLTTMHYHTLQDANALSQDLTPLLAILCALLIHPKLQGQQATLEHILDVASMISDDLSSEHMQSVLRQLPSSASNIPRLRYLFGTSTSPDAWLALASRVVAQPTSTPQASSPMSTTQSPSTLPRPSPGLPPRPAGLPPRPPSVVTSPNLAQGQKPPVPGPRGPIEIKQAPYQLRRWEIMPDPTPNMGANDTSLSLGLFQARKCV